VLELDRGDHEIGLNSTVKTIADPCAGLAKPDRAARRRRTAPSPAESTPLQAREAFYESADDSYEWAEG
jgi:hypothetical protein